MRALAGKPRPVARACKVATALVVGMPLLACAVPSGEPAALLSDGPGGMTCQFYVAAGLARWQRQGGDWIDAAGTLHGERPFSTANVQRDAAPTPLTLDATALAAAWTRGAAVAGGVLLRLMAGVGPVELASREHEAKKLHPLLRLAWDDGKQEELSPGADTSTGCPAYSNAGLMPLLQAGNGRLAMLTFPVQPRPGHEIVKAQLALSLVKTYSPATLGLYALHTPAARAPAAALAAGLSAQHPGDAGIEKAPGVLYVERFERAGWSSAWRAGEGGVRGALVADDADNGFEPLEGRALKISIEERQNVGLDVQLPLKQLPGGEPDEAFFRYYLRLGDDWNPTVDGGKLPGFGGTYGRAGWGGRKSDGYNGWSTRGAFMKQVSENPALAHLRSIGNYFYHADGAVYGDVEGWNLGPTGMLVKNRWYCIEQQVRLNQPGARDGVMRAWVDGELAFERTDLRFRHVPDLHIETVWLNVYHGGMSPAAKRMSVYIDNLVVARRYIGPRLQP